MRIIISGILYFFFFISQAQTGLSISPVSFAPAALYGDCPGLIINYSAGEIAVGQEGNLSGVWVLPGFEQPITQAYQQQVTGLPPCITDIKDFELHSIPFSLFPNPTTGIYQVHFTSNQSGSVQFQLNDLNGRQIALDAENCLPGETIKQFDIHSLAPGAYVIKTTYLSSTGEFYQNNSKILLIN